jgi:hypothetical protein
MEPLGLPALSTYADRHANDPVTTVGAPFAPEAMEPLGLPAISTYADSHLSDSLQTAGTSVK